MTGRVFLGWGAAEKRADGQAAQAREEDEESAARDYTPVLMVSVPAVLLLGVIVIGLIPGVVPGIELGAAHFHDQPAYIGWVLRGGVAHFAPAATSHIETYDYLYGLGASLGALGLAFLALFGSPLRERLPQTVIRPVLGFVGGLRQLHSGHTGDYVAWWTAGAALFGGASLVLLK